MAGKNLGLEPVIDPDARVVRSTLGKYTEVGARTKITESIFGDYSYIVNDGDVIYTTVGKFCSIAAQVRINPGNHPMHRASQSHFTYRASHYFEGEADEPEFFDWRRSTPVTIGHDVWIGHGVVILPGCSIGTGAVIGAGAVVTRDVAPWEIVVGVPARRVRMRFEAEVIEGLRRLAWWDWSHETLRERLPDFRKLGAADFVARYLGA